MVGIDLKTVQELLGHKTFGMTLRYAHLFPNHKRRAVDILCRRMDIIWTSRQKIKETLQFAFLRKLNYNEGEEDLAGVAELVDALDSKSSEVCPS